MPTTTHSTAAISNSERKRKERLKQQLASHRQAKLTALPAHRQEELYWKGRLEQPEWSNAFTADHERIRWRRGSETVGDVDGMHSGDSGRSSATAEDGSWTDRRGQQWSVRKIKLVGPSNGGGHEADRHAILFPDRPGLVLLPGFATTQQQRRLIQSCLHETTGPKSRTSLDTHYHAPSQGWWNLYTCSPCAVVQPRHNQSQHHGASTETSASDSGTTTTPTITIREGEEAAKATSHAESKREQKDLPPMDKNAYLSDKEAKMDPTPSDTVKALPVCELIRKMRWTILGLEYHWGTKSYKWDSPAMPLPYTISSFTQSIVRSVPWQHVFGPESPYAAEACTWPERYRSEAGVVNFYQHRDALTAHVDQSEVDTTKPLVSVSLGESAIFLVGGKTREEATLPLLLRSGDCLIMSGESRRIFHGVPRIVEDDMDSGLLDEPWDEATAFSADIDHIKEFIKGTRININVRQVFTDEHQAVR